MKLLDCLSIATRELIVQKLSHNLGFTNERASHDNDAMFLFDGPSSTTWLDKSIFRVSN